MSANETLSEEKQIAIAVTRSYLGEECARRFGKDLVRQWFEAELEAGKPIDPAEFFLPLKSNQAACPTSAYHAIFARVMREGVDAGGVPVLFAVVLSWAQPTLGRHDAPSR